jgi:hypothetical protein
MIGETIAFLLRNVPAILFVALVLAALTRGRASRAERLLAWTLLLPIGVTGLWAGVSPMCFFLQRRPLISDGRRVRSGSRLVWQIWPSA